VARESYCPQCFARIPVDAEICSVCGVDISALSERDYNEKLVHALHHPLSDIRLRAIVAL
jgi:predicted amidophosphoribosyltransferase